MKPNKQLIKEVKTNKDIVKSFKSIKRLDKDGYLYFMENSFDYLHNKTIIKTVYDFEQATKKWVTTTFVDACSAFCALDFKGNMLTGRAYDFGHYDKNIKHYGLNLMIHTAKNPKYGIKYESIATTDICLALSNITGKVLKNGALDRKDIDLTYLSLVPHFITDGINDQGLTASILLLPLDNLIKNKKSEPTAYTIKKSNCKLEMSIPRAIRHIIDNCKSVKEVEDMLKHIWFLRFSGNNSHIFVTDKLGNSRLFEWYIDKENANTQKFISIKTNAVTNFYQAFSYMPKDLPYLTNLKNKYSYGYCKDGNYRNTYDRFNTLASMLDFYTVKAGDQAIMKKQTVDSLLKTVALYSCPSSPTHQTQFSCLFDASELSQKIYSFANLDKSWTYSLKKHKFI